MFFKRLFLIFLVIPFLLNGAGSTTYAQVQPEPMVTPFDSQIAIQSKHLDPRAQILEAYLAKHNSPAVNYSQDFIDAADKYSIDWKLVPAISGVESTFCQFIPGGQDPNYSSYNCWGWGVYGNQTHKFNSFKDGIYTVSQGLRERYINQGLTNPYAINHIYASSPTWGSRVSYFISDLSQFERQYEANHPQFQTTTTTTSSSQLNIKNYLAGASATLSN